MAKLVVEKGSDKGRTLDLTTNGIFILGRDNSAQLKITDSLVSRLHCKIELEPSGMTVKDLDSLNGIFVNGEKVKERKISVGDMIELGETVISVLADSEGAKHDRLVGETIGGYRIVERVGRGGMGTVYKAIQLRLNRIVALKLLSEDLVKDPTFINLFIQEARSAAQLNHPNIIQIYDFNRAGDLCYFSMEFVPNGSVQELIVKEKKLPVDRAVKMIIDSCNGLLYAEKKGIVHRDIKPDNLMLSENEMIKIGDLGLAKSFKDHTQKEQGIFGTPHYIAPEQALGKDVDHRADIYSLGATFYRMLSGTTPYSGSNVKEIITKKIKEDHQPIKTHVPDLPDKLVAIIDKMMQKDVEKRYASASAIIEDLESFQRKPVDAKPVRAKVEAKVAEAAPKKSNKTMIMAGGAAFAAIVVIAAIIGFSNPGNPDADITDPTHIDEPLEPQTPIGPQNNEILNKLANELLKSADERVKAIDLSDPDQIDQAIAAYKNVMNEVPDHPNADIARARMLDLEKRKTDLVTSGEAAKMLGTIHEELTADLARLRALADSQANIENESRRIHDTYSERYSNIAGKYPATDAGTSAQAAFDELEKWYEEHKKEQSDFSNAFFEMDQLFKQEKYGDAATIAEKFLSLYPQGIFAKNAAAHSSNISERAFQRYQSDVEKPVKELVVKRQFDNAKKIINEKYNLFNYRKLDPKFSQIVSYVDAEQQKATNQDKQAALNSDIALQSDIYIRTIPLIRKYEFAEARKALNDILDNSSFQTKEYKAWSEFEKEKLKALEGVKTSTIKKLEKYAAGEPWRKVTYNGKQWEIEKADEKALCLKAPGAGMKMYPPWKDFPIEVIIAIVTEDGKLFTAPYPKYDDLLAVSYLYFEFSQNVTGETALNGLKKKASDEKNTASVDKISFAQTYLKYEYSFYNDKLAVQLYESAYNLSNNKNYYSDAHEKLKFIKEYLSATDFAVRRSREIEDLITKVKN